MAISFSIREYTSSMRSSDEDKCWPFDPEEKDRSLPSMDVRKFRWWAEGLDRKVKHKSPKKRSITELFAMAPQISTVEARSDGADENHEQELTTPDLVTNDTLPDEVETKGKSKFRKKKKKKSRNESVKAAESKSDDLHEEGKQEKIKRRKKKVEVEIPCKSKDNTGEAVPSKLDAPCDITSGDNEIQPQCQIINTEAEKMQLTEEPDEVLIPLISILKKCKKNRNPSMKEKVVTFSDVDAIIGPDNKKTEHTIDPPTQLSKNEDVDTRPKCTIDINEALPESIDLNFCLEDHFTDAFNSTGASTGAPGSPKNGMCHSSDGTSSLPLNSPQQMCDPVPDFTKKLEPRPDLNPDLSTISTPTLPLDSQQQMCNTVPHCTKNLEPVPDLNSEVSTISMSQNASPEQLTHTVRLMGKYVTVSRTDLNEASTIPKVQETASSSHASSSYCTDSVNKYSNDNNMYSDMNFGTDRSTSVGYMPAPVISFPVVPGFNIYHPQFPMVSPPMISFPLGGSVFPQPYGLNFSGFRDRNYNSEVRCSKRDSVETVNAGSNKDKET